MGLNESGIGGQGEIETPGTFLGLEGKDYTKMGMQGVLAAGVGAASTNTNTTIKSTSRPWND